MFSDILLDHFQSPRNVGEIPDADAESEAENPVCGDRLQVWMRVNDGTILEVKWRAQGCAPAIAAASAVSEFLTGMTIEQARGIDKDAVEDLLGGLPARKGHAAVLVVTVVRRALAKLESERPA